jgi:GNAT superfamily N-acetyltransferase
MNVRAAVPGDRGAVEAFLREHHSLRVARLGELLVPLEHPQLVACAEDGRLLGVLTYVVRGEECEILTLHARVQWRGVGSALIEAVVGEAARQGCSRLWLLTTNDNVDALRFYQRRGFVLARLVPGGVDRARETLKPEIPLVGSYGIPIRDEVILERSVPGPANGLAG